MNSVASELAGEPLLFNWDSPRGLSVVFASFLVLSLVAHGLCFYVFQIVYPTPVAVLPPPARVTFVAPDSEEGRTLLQWIDAEDPALAFTTHLPPGAGLRALPSAEHVASYSVSQPILKRLPPLRPDLRIPSSQPPDAVRWLSRKSALMRSTGKTSISFSKDFDEFGAFSPSQARFTASNKETPEAVRFRAAMNDLGEIRYCFPINTSGDPALDEQVRLQIIRTRFAQHREVGSQPSSSLVWGIATVEWGNDVVRPEKAAAASVTP
jgi:hypothetical protein